MKLAVDPAYANDVFFLFGTVLIGIGVGMEFGVGHGLTAAGVMLAGLAIWSARAR